ncbi:MAG: hypothetical protein WD184_11170 [Acidimicrobiia bacterium]
MLGTLLAIGLSLTACGTTAGPVDAGESQSQTSTSSHETPVPFGFAYELTLGRRTADPGQEYFGTAMVTAEAPLADRFRTSDAVLVLDIVEVGEPRLNSTDDLWWSPPHSEDATLLRPAVGIDVVVRLVGVLKVRARDTSFALRPGTPDLSGIGTPHPARLVPSLPPIGEPGSIWVTGGVATVRVTAEEWQRYLSDWGSAGDGNDGVGGPADGGDPIPAEFTMEVGGQPGMDLAEGGRYVVFLEAVEVPQKDGSVHHVWTGSYSTSRSQLLLDPVSSRFVEPGTDTEVSVDELEAALTSALDADPEPSAYRTDEFARLFGDGG